MHRHLALTGAAAAARLGLDGFRGLLFPPLWSAPISSRPDASVLRTRLWEPPEEVNGVLVAPVRIILRDLATGLAPLPRWPGDRVPLSADLLVELAMEHALRDGLVTLSELAFSGARTGSAAVLAEVLARRPPGEPATDSYAETRGVQVLRRLGFPVVWRQVPILDGNIHVNTVDIVVPAPGRIRRPVIMRPELGKLVEVDSVEHHSTREGFDHDARRNTNYAALGYPYVLLTPNQIEHEPQRVLRAIEGARSARRPRPQHCR